MTGYMPILLADDNPRDAELALAALEEDQLADRTIVCRDGTEVLDYLHRRGAFAARPHGNPILIMLDVKMPKLDGVDVLRLLKQDQAFRHIPVVMLTSSKEAADIARCYDAGANAYVVKPVEFSAYVTAMRALANFWGHINEPPGRDREENPA